MPKRCGLFVSLEKAQKNINRWYEITGEIIESAELVCEKPKEEIESIFVVSECLELVQAGIQKRVAACNKKRNLTGCEFCTRSKRSITR